MTFPLAAILGSLFYGTELLLAWRRHSSRVPDGKKVDGGTLPLLRWVIGTSIAAALLLALWPVGPHFPAGFPWRSASVIVFAFGAALRWWAVVRLGRFFTVDVAVAPDQRVVDTGPYRWMRHPSYTGVLIQFAGWALSLDNVLAVPVVLVPIFTAFLSRMRTEEAVLLVVLGEDYAAYCRRTKRLVPGVY